MATPLMRWFDGGHLRGELREVSSIFADAAQRVEDMLPASAEKTVALRKLLESKDAAVRAMVESLDLP